MRTILVEVPDEKCYVSSRNKCKLLYRKASWTGSIYLRCPFRGNAIIEYNCKNLKPTQPCRDAGVKQ